MKLKAILVKGSELKEGDVFCYVLQAHPEYNKEIHAWYIKTKNVKHPVDSENVYRLEVSEDDTR